MDRTLVALAVVVAFGGGIGVGWALRGPTHDAEATPLRDEAKTPAPPSPAESATAKAAAKPSTTGSAESSGVAIADPIAWPKASDGAFVWPTTIPKINDVHRVDDTHYQVDEVVIQNSTMSHVRVVPSLASATMPAGARLFSIRPDSPLAKAGLKNGDTLVYVDEFPVASPDQALEAYATLRSRPVIALRLLRNGEPLVLHYQLTSTVPTPMSSTSSVPLPKPKKP